MSKLELPDATSKRIRDMFSDGLQQLVDLDPRNKNGETLREHVRRNFKEENAWHLVPRSATSNSAATIQRIFPPNASTGQNPIQARNVGSQSTEKKKAYAEEYIAMVLNWKEDSVIPPTPAASTATPTPLPPKPRSLALVYLVLAQ